MIEFWLGRDAWGPTTNLVASVHWDTGWSDMHEITRLVGTGTDSGTYPTPARTHAIVLVPLRLCVYEHEVGFTVLGVRVCDCACACAC